MDTDRQDAIRQITIDAARAVTIRQFSFDGRQLDTLPEELLTLPGLQTLYCPRGLTELRRPPLPSPTRSGRTETRQPAQPAERPRTAHRSVSLRPLTHPTTRAAPLDLDGAAAVEEATAWWEESRPEVGQQ